MIKLKHYKKFIGKELVQTKEKTPFKLRIIKAKYKVMPLWIWFKPKLNWFGELDFSVKYILFVFIVFLFIFGANKLRFEYWKNTVIKAYPDITKAVYDDRGNLIQPSPLDKIMLEFIKRTQATMFVIFGLLTGLTLRNIWGYIGTPKHQSMHK